MKKLLLLIIGFYVIQLQAQVTNEGQPHSWNLFKKSSIEEITLSKIDIKKLREEDKNNDVEKARPFRIGVPIEVSYDLTNSGVWTELENGDRIWRLLLNSKDAVHLSVVFNDFYLPKGSTIYLYNDDRTDLLGAYTNVENNDEKKLGTWFVKGDKVWIEYYEPKKVIGLGNLHISSVIHGYRLEGVYQKGYYDDFEKALNSSGNCNHDVDCPIGADFEAHKDHLKHSVAFLNMGDGYICSGALVNNTAQDQTPYFLTANHCYEREPTENPANPSLFSMRFNWISPNPVCAATTNSTNDPTNFVMSGSALRARNATSDFMLLELNNDIPATWTDITYAGWDRTDVDPDFEVGIHHPSGDIMKVSRDDTGATKATDGDGLYWLIDGVSGTGLGGGWEIGVTEGGSSGSPLFNQDGYIIGQLYAGLAECVGTNDNDEIDLYGRFAISWNNGTTASTRLRDWLDPLGTNQTLLGSYPAMETYTVDASISSSVPEIECGTYEATPSIVVSNAGTQTLTSLTINWNIDGGTSTTINWTGSLAQYQTEVLTLTPVTVTPGAHTFNVSCTNPNNGTDENSDNNTSSFDFNVTKEFLTSQVHLSLTTDNFSEETTWQFRNSVGTVLYSGGPYNGDTDDNTTFTASFDVSLGQCYTFEIFDSESDGICCDYGNGSYSLTADGGEYIINSNGDFGSSEATVLKIVDTLSINEEYLDKGISIYPNPTNTGVLNIRFLNPMGNLTYEVHNVLGQKIINKTELKNNETINLSNKQNGLYFVRITSRESGASVVKKVVVSK